MTEMEIIIRRSSEGTLVPITLLVRCKDCKNCIIKTCHKDNREGNPIENKYFCYGVMHGNCVQPDFYCADGKPKVGEQE